MATVQKEIDKWQPDWVALRILDFARKVHEFGNDDKALAEWARQMSEDLIFNNTSSEDEFTQNLLAEASDAYSKKSKAGRKGGIAKARNQKQKSPEAAGNGNAPDASGNGLEEFNDQETASGNYQVPDKVSTNNGDAAHREAADGETDGNVVTARTTVSNPLALDMSGLDKDRQNAKNRDSRGSGRYQPPSLGPEDGTNAAQPDSPANDQSDRHKRGREEPATDGDIREDSLNMLEGRNAVTSESGTSAAGDSFGEAREGQNPGEGRKTFATGSSHPVANPPPPCVLKHLQKCGKQKQKANAQSPPRSSEDVRLFAIDKHLDVDDARLWYQMNYIDRPGCDKDGVLILNWKGHCTAYCKAEAERRKAG